MFTRTFERLENSLLYVAMASIGAMMVLVSIDAICRYIFNAPLAFQFELTSNYLMVMSVVLAMAWAAREGAFIKISILGSKLPKSVRRIIVALNSLIVSVVFFLAFYESTIIAYDAWQNNDLIFGVIDWPVWLARVWVPIGTLMVSIRMLIYAYRLAVLKKNLPDDEVIIHED